MQQQPRRYRVSFIIRFDQVIEARNAAEARDMANALQALPETMLNSRGEVESCAWNTIEPLHGTDI